MADPVPRPLLPWLGRACRTAREEANVDRARIATAIDADEETVARFEDGIAWPQNSEEVLLAYANELFMDVRLLWVHAFVLWIETEPILDRKSKQQIRAALKRLQIS